MLYYSDLIHLLKWELPLFVHVKMFILSKNTILKFFLKNIFLWELSSNISFLGILHAKHVDKVQRYFWRKSEWLHINLMLSHFLYKIFLLLDLFNFDFIPPLMFMNVIFFLGCTFLGFPLDWHSISFFVKMVIFELEISSF